MIAGPGLLSGGALTPLGDLMFAAGGMMWAAFTELQKRQGLAPLQVTAAVSVLSALISSRRHQPAALRAFLELVREGTGGPERR